MTRWAVRILKYREKDNFEVLDLGFGFDEQGVNSLVEKIESQFDAPGFNLDDIEKSSLIERFRGLILKGENSADFHDKLVQILEPKELALLEEIILDNANIGRAKFEEIFGWTKQQISAINLYSTLLQMVETCESILKTKGLNRRTVASCKKQLKKLGNCERSKAFASDITEFIDQQLIQVPFGTTYLASTDIIESLIGKFKRLNQRVATVHGFNQSVLLFGTLTAKITPEKVKMAMETVSWATVKQWVKENVPISNWAKRCKALFDKNKEQKPTTT